MNKTKILAFIALGAILSACGSEEGTPPELVNSYPNSISPFDTLVVKFKSSLVEIDKLDESNNIILNQGKWIKGKATGKELRFIGTNTTPGGLNYFDGGTTDSIVFKKLKNADGYIKDKDIFYFSTYTILDKEPNGSETSANDIESIGNPKRGEGVIFAGVLDHKIGTTDAGDIYDMEDYYTLKLKAADTVSITVANSEVLSIIVKGPKGLEDKTFQALKGKTNVFTYIVGLEYLLEDSSLNAKDPVSFYIKAIDNAMTSKPNPYNIRIKVAEKK